MTYRDDDIHLESIQLISNEKCSYNLIVDLGFGDGRVTRMLSKHVQHKQLVAIDSVAEMLAYAVANNSSDDTSIEYVLQDMSVPWLELCPQIRQLESKVDLLFTNLMLNYITNKRQIIEIIGRLLSSGGLFFANIILFKDLNEKQLLNSQTDEDEEDKEEEQQLLCHSIDRQLDDWKQCLVDTGFTIKLFKRFDFNELADNRKQILDFMPEVFDCYGIYWSDRRHFDTKINGNDKFRDRVFNAYFSLPDKSVATASAAADISVMSWKQFLGDNTIDKLKFSWHLLQVMAYNNTKQ